MEKKAKVKYTYNLGIWYTFYKHCHQYENAFLPDDQLRKCKNPSSPEYQGDITKRDLTWDSQELFRLYYYEDLKHHYADEKYQAYVNQTEDDAKGKASGIAFTLGTGVAFLLTILNACLVPFAHSHQYNNMVIVSSVFLAVGILTCCFLTFWFSKNKKKMIHKDGEDKMVNQILSFDEWFDQNIENTPKWDSLHLEAFTRFQKRLEQVESSPDRIQDYEILKKAREYLQTMIEIPLAYTNERDITHLYELCLLGKATNLEKGMKCLKDESLIAELSTDPYVKDEAENRMTYQIENNRNQLDPELLRLLSPNRFIYKSMEKCVHQNHSFTSEDLIQEMSIKELL